MLTRAPGKLVLSGAYVVLDGAPAVVAAVDRYAVADTARSPSSVSEELRAAFGDRAPPIVDTSSMRADGRKLGLGSSAATIVAALAADRWRHRTDAVAVDDAERSTIASLAFAAHRRAQGGGSGIDVVASAHGGILACIAVADDAPRHRALQLPAGLLVEVWSCPESASTARLLRPVRALRESDPARYATLTAAAHAGAAALVDGFERGDVTASLLALAAQRDCMRALGAATEAPILPVYLLALGDAAAASGAVFAQAGAGGGDVALFFGRAPSSPELREQARRLGLRPLAVTLGAPGVHVAPPNLLSTSPTPAST